MTEPYIEETATKILNCKGQNAVEWVNSILYFIGNRYDRQFYLLVREELLKNIKS